MNKRLSIITILLSLTANLWAIPAKPGLWRTITLADGREVRVVLTGDEFGHCWRDAEGMHYRELTNGLFQPIDNMERMATRSKQRRAKANTRRAARRTPIGGEHLPYIGEKKGLVILTEFKDKSFKNHIDSIDSTATQIRLKYDSICNHQGYTDKNFVGSVRDYFRDNSYGLFDLTFDVVGPIRMPHNYKYYGEDDPDMEEGYDMRPGLMVATACKMIKDSVDFSQYDWDGDGVVEQVYILYAGKGQANGGNSNTIWPHEYELEYTDYGNTLEINGITINTYACSNELNNNNALDGIGTMCHEFSHCLGIPDIYDIDYYNYGMDQWDLMSSGSYNNNSYTPAGYTSYEKIYAGWLAPTVLVNDTTIEAMEPLALSPEAYILYNEGHPDEYLLLENRQRIGWDAALPGKGMLAIHLDFDSSIWENNMVNCTSLEYLDDDGKIIKNTHQRCTLLAADNMTVPYYGVGNDAYPYYKNDSITSKSRPAMKWYNPNQYGNVTFYHAIKNIAVNEDNTMRFDYERREPLDPPTDFAFFESFDKCNARGGNDNYWSGTVGNGDFLPDYSTWTAYQANGANQCAKIGNFQTAGYLVTPYIQTDDQQQLTFKAAPWNEEEGERMMVTFFNATDTIRTDTLEAMPVMQWSEYTIDVPAAEKMQIKFQCTANRFFIDEVCMKKRQESGINALTNDRVATIQRRYNLNGQRVTTGYNGIVIINGKKFSGSADVLFRNSQIKTP